MARATNEPFASDTIAGIMSQGQDGRRTFFRLSIAVAILAVVITVVMLLIPLFPRPLSYRAKLIVDLPSDARVSQVKEQRGISYGSVIFELPEPKGPGSRMPEVWLDAGMPSVSPPTSIRIGMGPGTPAAMPASSISAAKSVRPVVRKAHAPGAALPMKTPSKSSPRSAALAPLSLGEFRTNEVTTPTGTSYTLDYRSYRVRLEYQKATHLYTFQRIMEPNDPGEP